MADERDPQVSRHYRELGGDEPPPAIDHAILAASRRARAPRRLWYLPLAAAAAALLAVGIALHVERGQQAPRQMKQGPAPVARPAPSPELRKQEAPRSAAREAPPAISEDALRSEQAVEQSPERLLERIAALRGEGRHEEADKALAELRQRYPDHPVPDALTNRK